MTADIQRNSGDVVRRIFAELRNVTPHSLVDAFHSFRGKYLQTLILQGATAQQTEIINPEVITGSNKNRVDASGRAK